MAAGWLHDHSAVPKRLIVLWNFVFPTIIGIPFSGTTVAQKSKRKVNKRPLPWKSLSHSRHIVYTFPRRSWKMKFKYLFERLRPKTAVEAATTKHRIAMVYAFFGWNSFIYFFYLAFSKDKPTDPAERSIRCKLNNPYRGPFIISWRSILCCVKSFAEALILSKMSKDQKCYTVHLDGLTLLPSGRNVQDKKLTSPSLQADTMGE